MDMPHGKSPHPNPARLAHLEKSGWRINEWCNAIGIARSTYYTLADPPTSMRIGTMHIITESPDAWLSRMRQQADHAVAAA